MTMSQTAINERCNRWLADILERRGLANPHDLAKHITTELLAQGLAPVPRPFPLKATAPVASEEARRAATEAAAEAVAAAKAKRTRVGPPPTPSVEDLVAGAALLGLNQNDVATAIEQLNLAVPTADDQPAAPYPTGQTATYPVHSGDPLDDDVVDAVIHEADCPGGDCQCADDQDAETPSSWRVTPEPGPEWTDVGGGLLVAPAGTPGGEWHVPGQPEPELDEPVSDTWGPDDPPF